MFLFVIFFRNCTLPIESLDYQNDGTYDVTVSTFFSESELPSRTIFFCELVIPNTSYNMTKRFVYNPGKKTYLYLLAFYNVKKISSKKLLSNIIYFVEVVGLK